MKHALVTLVIIMILKDTPTFQVLFIVSLFCAWNITTVEINSGIHLLKLNPPNASMVFTSGGLGLGLKNLVLFTSPISALANSTYGILVLVTRMLMNKSA